ncbi:hypothetical protein ACFRAE_12710 [Sphingobacterium sp. HJSM2_6]
MELAEHLKRYVFELKIYSLEFPFWLNFMEVLIILSVFVFVLNLRNKLWFTSVFKPYSSTIVGANHRLKNVMMRILASIIYFSRENIRQFIQHLLIRITQLTESVLLTCCLIKDVKGLYDKACVVDKNDAVFILDYYPWSLYLGNQLKSIESNNRHKSFFQSAFSYLMMKGIFPKNQLFHF